MLAFWRIRMNSAEIVLWWPSATITVSGTVAYMMSQFLVHVKSNFVCLGLSAASCSTALITLPASGFFRQYQLLSESRWDKYNYLENIDPSLCRFRIPALRTSTIVSVSCELVSTEAQPLKSSQSLPQPATRAVTLLINCFL